MSRVRAVCTWGDGPDVIVVVSGRLVAHGGTEKSFDLTAKEARIFAAELNTAAKHAEELNDSYETYEEK